MKYFFVNLLLKVFYKLPIWFLNIFFRKSHYIRDNYLDQQANVFLKLIGIFGYKPNINDFNHKERLQTNFARISLSLTKKPQSTFSFKDLNIGQSSELIAREYTPDSIKSQKVMLYFHGGGYALGSIDTHHDFVSLLANKLGIKIYSLEYSLSPENKYPRALQEAEYAYNWLLNQGFDNSDVLVCGDSAGAHLAASLSFVLADGDKPMPSAQLLIYPMVSPTLQFESMDLYKEDFLLTRASMEWFWGQLSAKHDDNSDPMFNLLKQDKPKYSQTRSLVITAGFDPLCDEGHHYADLLEKNGNIVKKLHFPDLFHGFVNFTNLTGPEKAVKVIIKEFRDFL